jgi:WD40 repeat protein
VVVVGAGDHLRCWALASLSELSGSAAAVGRLSCLATAVVDGQPVALAGTPTGDLLILTLPGLEPLSRRAAAHDGEVVGVAAPRSGPALVASYGSDGSLALWRLPGLEPLQRRSHPQVAGTGLSLATLDGREVLVSCGDRLTRDQSSMPVAVWTLPELELRSTLGGEVPQVSQTWVLDVAGEPVLVGPSFSYVNCWALRTGALLFQSEDVRAEHLFPLAATGRATEVLLHSGGQTRKLTVERSADDLSVTASPWTESALGTWTGPVTIWDRRHLVSAGSELRLWDTADLLAAIDAAPLSDQAMFREQRAHGLESVVGVEDRIWAGSGTGSLHCWLGADGRPVQTTTNDHGELVALQTVETEGRRVLLVAGFDDGTVQLLDARTGQALPELRAGAKLLALAAARVGGRALLATATTQQPSGTKRFYQVRLWELPSGQELVTRHDPLGLFGEDDDDRFDWRLAISGAESKQLRAVAFAPSSRGDVVVAGGRGGLSAWRVDTLEPVLPGLFAFGREVTGLASYRAGTEPRLAVTTEDGQLLAFGLERGEPVLRAVRAHRSWLRTCVAAVRWRGRPALATGGSDSTVRVWNHDHRLLAEIPLEVPMLAPVRAIAPLASGDLAIATLRGLVVIASH